MSEGLSLHIQEEKEKSLPHSTDPHIDSGPLQPPSNVCKTIFTRRKNKRPNKNFLSVLHQIQGNKSTSHTWKTPLVLKPQNVIHVAA